MGLESGRHFRTKRTIVSRPELLPLAEGLDWGADTPPVTQEDVDRTRNLLNIESGVTTTDYIPGARVARRVTKTGGRRALGEPVTPTIGVDELKSLIVSPIKDIPWRHASPEALREVIEAVARQAVVPLSLLEGKDFMTEIDELGGRNLRGLFVYGQRLEDETEKTAMGKLFKVAKIKTSLDDLSQAKEVKREIHWDQIQSETIRELLRHIAKKRGKRISKLSRIDLEQEYPSLGGIKPDGLYFNALRDEDRGDQDPMQYLLTRSGFQFSRRDYSKSHEAVYEERDFSTEDLIEKIKSGKIIQWLSLPPDTIYGLLLSVEKETGVPASLLSKTEYFTNFDFLNNRNLVTFWQTIERDYQKKRNGRPVLSFINELAGMEIKTEEIVTIFNLKPKRSIPWEAIPTKNIRELLELVASSRGIPASLLKRYELTIQYPFLGDRDLTGLREYFLRLYPEDANLPFMQWCLNNVGITQSTVTAQDSQYRDYIRKIVSGNIKQEQKRYAAAYLEDEVIANVFEAFYDQSGREKTIFTAKTRRLIADLSPLQQAILRGIHIGHQSLEDVTTDINPEYEKYGLKEKVDTKILQAHYDDAIIALAIKLISEGTN